MCAHLLNAFRAVLGAFGNFWCGSESLREHSVWSQHFTGILHSVPCTYRNFPCSPVSLGVPSAWSQVFTRTFCAVLASYKTFLSFGCLWALFMHPRSIWEFSAKSWLITGTYCVVPDLFVNFSCRAGHLKGTFCSVQSWVLTGTFHTGLSA